MADDTEFADDVLFTDGADGGEITIENGLVKCDKAFSTAVYLSLFGGNAEDDGKVENTKGWWGNYTGDVQPEEKMVSRFQHYTTLPLTSANLKLAEKAAEDDLAWMIDDGMADTISATGIIDTPHHAVFSVVISKNSETIFSAKYGIQWEAGINGI